MFKNMPEPPGSLRHHAAGIARSIACSNACPYACMIRKTARLENGATAWGNSAFPPPGGLTKEPGRNLLASVKLSRLHGKKYPQRLSACPVNAISNGKIKPLKKKEPPEANTPERLLHVVSVYILEAVTGPQDRAERAVHVRLGKFVAALVVQAELAIKQQFGANRQFQVRKGRDVEVRAARIAGTPSRRRCCRWTGGRCRDPISPQRVPRADH